MASARFIEKKNLCRLIRAYARYRDALSDSADIRLRTAANRPWSLVLVGDGAQRPSLQRTISDLGLEACVRLPGFKQYSELPVYYGLAAAFIHASTSEPWGLVVNEAMASGLPVLVSNRCGCAPDLVRDGKNGFTFDPYDVEQLAELMLRLSTLASQCPAMSKASAEIIANWGPNRFSQGLRAAAKKATDSGLRSAAWWQSIILRLLLRR